MEQSLSFLSNGFHIDALIERGSSLVGVVICHPHPLYGGEMYNPVVDAIRQVYRQKCATTLRFNFRGTGKSEGRHDEGRGEQSDVAAAVITLRNEGMDVIHLAGYSFGAYVNAWAVSEGLKVSKMVMVSPPLAMMPFDNINPLPCLDLVITGANDEIAPPEKIIKTLPSWNPSAKLEVIEATDHFYVGGLQQLKAVLNQISVNDEKNT